jgi:hypothetical protein
MSERPTLLVKDDWWQGDYPKRMPVTKADPLWKARQGRLIHRPLSGMVYLRDDGSYRNTHFKWLCGNGTNEPIRVKPECMEGLMMCQLCEAKHLIREPSGE